MPAVKFLVGCDPELMIEDVNKNLKSSIPIIPGTKYTPHKVKSGAILSDNVNFEFNVKPAKSSKEFVKNIGSVLHSSISIINKHNLKFVVKASADFPKEELQDPAAQAFGCEPDYDAWTVSVNSVSPNAAKKQFRSAGGHIHVGWSKGSEFLKEIEGKLRMIKAMDMFLGIPSILIDKDPSSPARRGLYGKAGCHRPKEYGVEYRAIGNFWVNSPELVDLMYNLTAFAVEFCAKGLDTQLVNDIGQKNIIHCINHSDKVLARKLLNGYILNLLPKNLVKDIEKAIKTNYDFYNSWNL